MAKRGGNARRQKSNNRSNGHHQAQDAEARRQKSNDSACEHNQTRNNSNNTNNKYNHELFSSLNALPYFTYEQAQLYNELLKQQKQNKRSNNQFN